MPNLPSGTVTFLFTDIEGSTRLWQAHPDAMQVALARHDALLRTAIESHSGYVFKTVGDEFCTAFPTAPEALAAALAIQRALHAEDWSVETGLPRPSTIKVRMGLHTGAAEIRENDYFGASLSRVARLMAAGHGGQVLLSAATQELIQDDLPAGVTLKGLGERRLRDLVRPEQIFQLVAPDLPADFPALRTLEAFPNNLPLQLTSFIGREREMAELKRVLGKSRLVTLTGVGGTGKTRLALQVAADMLDAFPDGAWLVELAPLSNPGLVAEGVASALGVREEPGRPLLATLTDHLKAKHLLLLLDNCEHLIEACARLAEDLLRTCPHLRILATSREALGVAGEATFPTPSLAAPDLQQTLTPQSLSQYEAVRLFIDRAVAVRPDFAVTNENAPAVAQVCHRLDGIPLAIELAAARIKAMSVEQIARRLDDRFRLLTGGSRTALPRQQTLQAMIDWSHNLLTGPERTLLRRLSVFAGGWSLEGAEAVCADVGQDSGHPRDVVLSYDVLDTLSHLVDKSLVLALEQEGEVRYRLLETIRQYAREKLLESGERDKVRQRHLGYYLQLAEEAEPQLFGVDQSRWFRRLETEYDNIRAALEGSMAGEGGVLETGWRLGAALWWFWHEYLHSELLWWLEAVFQSQKSPQGPGDIPLVSHTVKAKVLPRAALLAINRGHLQEAAALAEAGLVVCREVRDNEGLAFALAVMGFIHWSHGTLEQAQQLLQQSLELCQRVGHKWGISYALLGLGIVMQQLGDYRQATMLLEKCLALRRELGSPFGIASSLSALGIIAWLQGDFRQATARFEESLALGRKIEHKSSISSNLWGLGMTACYRGDYAQAAALFQESLALAQNVGIKRNSAWNYWGLGRLAHYQGDYARAQVLLGEVLRIFQEINNQGYIFWVVQELAAVAAAQQHPDRAARLLGADAALRAARKIPLPPVMQADVAQTIAAARAQLGDAAFEVAWAEGQAMALEQAVKNALDG